MENIVVAQEIVDSMRRKRGKTERMLIKMDLEKAYDRLNWTFIYETLCLVGLPMDSIQVIMECIASMSMRILWNEELTESFSPSMGVK